jgi:hypothetical protein
VGGVRILKGAEHHAFLRIYTRFKTNTREIVTNMPPWLHRQYHTYVDKFIRNQVPGAPSIWHPGGQKYWAEWISKNPNGMNKIIEALKRGTSAFEELHAIKGLREALEAALR